MFPKLKSKFPPSEYKSDFENLAVLDIIAGCDKDLLGFLKISLWLQYGRSGCSTDRLVVVGTSRVGGCCWGGLDLFPEKNMLGGVDM